MKKKDEDLESNRYEVDAMDELEILNKLKDSLYDRREEIKNNQDKLDEVDHCIDLIDYFIDYMS